MAYSGRGAADNGGRWNRPGIHVVYASSSLSLATLEYLVNIESNELPSDLVVIAARIPDDIEVARVSARDLPVDWRSSPSPVNLKKIGEGWLRKAETAVLLQHPLKPGAPAVRASSYRQADALRLRPQDPGHAIVGTCPQRRVRGGFTFYYINITGRLW
ncbi:MAG: RES domain protein [Actinobacteria bacterium]|nr:RES domain protein [Actinomycetota bacterium]